MSFEALQKQLEEVQTLQKSLTDGGTTTATATTEAGDGGAGDDGKTTITVTLPDGSTAEAEDATEMMKSLTARLDETDNFVQSGMGEVVSLLKGLTATVVNQGKLLAANTAEIAALKASGTGRKSVLNDQGQMQKSLQDQGKRHTMDGNEFMAKCLEAQKDGRITGVDVALAEASINRGEQIPERIARAVLK